MAEELVQGDDLGNKGVGLVLDGSEDIRPYPAALAPWWPRDTDVHGDLWEPSHSTASSQGLPPTSLAPNTPVPIGNSSSQPQISGESPAPGTVPCPWGLSPGQGLPCDVFATRWGPKIGNANMPPGAWRDRVPSGLALGTLV